MGNFRQKISAHFNQRSDRGDLGIPIMLGAVGAAVGLSVAAAFALPALAIAGVVTAGVIAGGAGGVALDRAGDYSTYRKTHGLSRSEIRDRSPSEKRRIRDRYRY